jgi:hypothetical protein
MKACVTRAGTVNEGFLPRLGSAPERLASPRENLRLTANAPDATRGLPKLSALPIGGR